MNKNTFCVMPFLQLNVWPNGNLKPCCISKDFENVKINNLSVKDAYNSDEFKQLRRDMINGVKNPLCSVCYDSEEFSSSSYRIAQNTKYELIIDDVFNEVSEDGEVELNFRDLDLRLSSKCNLKCRACNFYSSSSWIKEESEFHLLNKWNVAVPQIRKVKLDLDQSALKNLVHLYIAGGEPLYMKEMYDFINKLTNKDQILCFINTNFTIVNHESFEEKFMGFKLIQFIISCDGIGELGEYLRTNMKWDVFLHNLNTLKAYEEKMDNLTHIFQYTCSVLNCFNFFELREFLYQNKFILDDNQVKFGFVITPDWYDIVNFEELRHQVISYFETNISLIDKNSILYIDIMKFLNYLKEGKMTSTNQHTMLKSAIEFGNQFNKTTLPKELDYIYKLYDK